MGVLICLRESALVGMGAMFGGDVIQSRLYYVLQYMLAISLRLSRFIVFQIDVYPKILYTLARARLAAPAIKTKGVIKTSYVQ